MKFLGKGATGEVWALDKDTVWKASISTTAKKNEMKNEMQLARYMGKAGIGPRVGKWYEDGERFGYTMERYDMSMHTLLKHVHDPNVIAFLSEELKSLFRRTLKALGKEIVCLDVKPANVLVRIRNGNLSIVITDWDPSQCVTPAKRRLWSMQMLFALNAWVSHGVLFFAKEVLATTNIFHYSGSVLHWGILLRQITGAGSTNNEVQRVFQEMRKHAKGSS